jgi:hypothetical protein
LNLRWRTDGGNRVQPATTNHRRLINSRFDNGDGGDWEAGICGENELRVQWNPLSGLFSGHCRVVRENKDWGLCHCEKVDVNLDVN